MREIPCKQSTGNVEVDEQMYHPKFDEVPKICSSYKKAVKQRICQEQHEVLVVGESDAVVHPDERRKAVWSGDKSSRSHTEVDLKQ